MEFSYTADSSSRIVVHQVQVKENTSIPQAQRMYLSDQAQKSWMKNYVQKFSDWSFLLIVIKKKFPCLMFWSKGIYDNWMNTFNVLFWKQLVFSWKAME